MEDVIQFVNEKVGNICSELTNGNCSDFEDILLQIDLVIDAVSYLDSITKLPEEFYSDLFTARGWVEAYLGFAVPQISELLRVSVRTIERRISSFGLTAKKTSQISDEELDDKVIRIKSFNPNCGSKVLAGYIAASGIRVPRERVRQSLRRVDLMGTYLRRCTSIRRRVYMLQNWVNGWVRHPLQSERNLTPLQLWTRGMFNSSSLPYTNDTNNIVHENYGIDWDGPINTNDTLENTVSLSDLNCPLDEEEAASLKANVQNKGFSANNCTPVAAVQTYQFVKEFVSNHVGHH
eukprot:gene21138-23216_t